MNTTVPVPATCSASLLVFAPEPLPREDDLPRPQAALLRRHGTGPAALERFESCTHQMAVTITGPCTGFAQRLRDLRVEALTLAEQHGGVVVATDPPHVIEQTSDDVDLARAGQWYSLDPDAIAEHQVRTDGLSQFGLPEIVVRQVDPARRAMVDAVVAGLAHRLIDEWPQNDPVGAATVTLRDIAFGLGDPQAASTGVERSIDVLIDYDIDTHALVVHLTTDPAEALFAG